MQVIGNVATEPTRRSGNTTGKVFYTFRLGESYGRDENRTTTWYDITYFPESEVDVDLLSVGARVKVTGRLEAKAFMRNSATPTPGASLNVLTSNIEHVAPRDPVQGPAQAPAQAQRPPQAPQGLPERAPGADERAFSGMDDDIPF